MKSYYSSGKLLLTGEYTVLDGALALAVPTQFGQSLIVQEIESPKLIWKSIDEKENVWFETVFKIENGKISKQSTEDNEITNRLLDILNAVRQLNPNFLSNNVGYEVTTILEFPKNWGLGTSSTLINNIANWTKVDAYKLLELTFGGSGYDIACAQNASAITYRLHNNEILKQVQGDKKISQHIQSQENNRIINKRYFNPDFKEHLFFVHLNKKQNSRDGIAQYKKNTSNLTEVVSEISDITESMLSCTTLDVFNSLIERHEQIIAAVIHQKPVKEALFKDFYGSIKSLGAWGGDFILVTSKTNPKEYFKSKGFETILPFKEMVSNSF